MGKGAGKRAPDGVNPSGKDGKRMLCHLCGSVRHFMSDCPKGRTPGPFNNSHLATAYAYNTPSSQSEAGAHVLTILM
eukprot:9540111-Heterocapsa_arctica.AAC.1